MQTDGVVIWLDILGFKEFLLDEERSFKEWPKIERHLYNNLKNISKAIQGHGVTAEFLVISDTIVVYTKEISSSSILFILLIAIFLQSSLHGFGFLSRGVITIGKINTSRRAKMNTIIGYPIVEAASYESQLDCPLVVIGPSLAHRLIDDPALLDGSITSLPPPFDAVKPTDLMYPATIEFRKLGRGNTAVVIHPAFYSNSLTGYFNIFLENIRDMGGESIIAALNKLERLKATITESCGLEYFENLIAFLAAFHELYSRNPEKG